VDAKTAAKAEALVDLMARMSSICKLGEPKDMLGIETSCECGARTIPIWQAASSCCSVWCGWKMMHHPHDTSGLWVGEVGMPR
jgi:hypothetical protein